MMGTALAKAWRREDLGSVSPRGGVAALTGRLDQDLPVQGQLDHGVLQDASVSAHLLPGQIQEGDVFLQEAQQGAIVAPVVLGSRFRSGSTLHLDLGAELSSHDAP